MSAARREDEGHNLMAEAESKLSSRGGFFRSLLGGSSSSKEEAAATFVKAANSFKLAKSWAQAGAAYERAAATYSGISDMEYEAASKYTDAAKAYKNTDSAKAISAYENAIDLYTDSARFQQCARLKKEVAEMYEADDNVNAALESYKASADFYDMEDNKSNANSMRIKIAEHTAKIGKFDEAGDLYEQIAQTALANNLLKYGAREHLLRAGLCRLCVDDAIAGERALEKYQNMDSSFGSSREGKLLQSVVTAFAENDLESFTNQVYEYDSVSKLDEWKTSVLVKIKNRIRADDEDLT